MRKNKYSLSDILFVSANVLYILVFIIFVVLAKRGVLEYHLTYIATTKLFWSIVFTSWLWCFYINALVVWIPWALFKLKTEMFKR